MNVYLTGTVNSRMVEKLFSYGDSLKKKDHLYVWLNSPGGYLSDAEVILNYFESMQDRMTLIMTGSISSAALHLALRTTVPKQILPSTIGWAHQPRVLANITQSGKLAQGEDDAELFLKDKQSLKEFMSVYEPLLTPKQFLEMKKGKDIPFNPKEFINLFKKQQKIQNEYFKNLSKEYE